MSKHTISDLHQMQAMPLKIKVRMTEERLRQWVDEYGIDGVYVSFSGGKDSTVLLDIARKLYPAIKAVFIDTGLEYPEIRKFVKTYENVDWLKPKKNFKQVIDEYGYPFISKEVCECVSGAKRYLTELQNSGKLDRQTDTYPTSTSTKNLLEQADMLSMINPSRGGEIQSGVNLEDLANILNYRMKNKTGGQINV